MFELFTLDMKKDKIHIPGITKNVVPNSGRAHKLSACEDLTGGVLREINLSNLAGNKISSPGSIDLIVPVLGGDDNAVVADVVTLVADDEHFGGSYAAEALVAVGITKGDDCFESVLRVFQNGQNSPALTLAAAAAVSLCVAV